MSEEQGTELPPWSEVTARSKPKRCTPKLERDLDVPGLKVIETVNDLFITPVDYQSYCLLNKFSCYEHDVASKLHKTGKEIAIQM